jgi:hypothetical protein
MRLIICSHYISSCFEGGEYLTNLHGSLLNRLIVMLRRALGVVPSKRPYLNRIPSPPFMCWKSGGGGGIRDHRDPPQKQVQNGGAQHLRNGQELASADHFANVEHRRVQLASVFRSPSHDGGLGLKPSGIYLCGIMVAVGWWW